MTEFEIVEDFTPEFEIEHENFILNHKNSMMYHSIKYFNFLKGLIGVNPISIVSKENGRIDGVLPLMMIEGSFGKIINSLPYFGSNGSVLCTSEKKAKELVKIYNDLASMPNVGSSTIITNPLDSYDLKNDVNFNQNDYRIGQFTNIQFSDNHEENLIRKIHFKTRNVIRKAKKLNVNTIIDNSKLDLVHKLHEENMDSIGGLAKNVNIINAIRKNYIAGKDYNVYLAIHSNNVVAGLLVFYFKNIVEYYMPVIKKEFRNLQGLSLLIFEAMKQASSQGFKLWNWGGTWENQKGVYSFKKKWGTYDKKYYYLTKVNNDNIYKMDKDSLIKEYPNFYILPFNKLRNFE